MSVKKLSVFTLCTLILLSLFTGCSTQSKQQAPQAQEVISQKRDVTLQSIEQDIKKLYGDQVEKVLFNNKYGEDTVLIEAKMKQGASCYYMYNMTTGENYQLPIELSFVNTTKIVNENNVVFDMTGGNSETPFVEPPYRMNFRKVVEDGKFAFVGSKEKLHFGLGDSISFGENINDAYLLKDLRATLDGIQFSFKVSTGEAAVFPLISTSFDASSRQLIIKAERTKKDNVDYLSKLITENPNVYMDSIKLEENNNTMNIILKLNNDVTYYTTEICDGSFVEICFSNNR